MHFSIITITKKNPIGFQKTKQSIESQNCSDFEWVVVDGDKEPDNGIYDAMNKGLDRAKGDYIIFMNAGDVFYDAGTLSRIAQQEADFIYGDAAEDGNFIKRARSHTQITKGMITHHQAMVYKRSVIADRRYDESYKIAADYKFTVQHIMESKTFAYIDQPLCIFESGGVSQTHAARGRGEEKVIRSELGLRSPLTPYRQWAAGWLKARAPALYLKLRAIANQ